MSLVTYDVNSESENEEVNGGEADKQPQEIFNYCPASSVIKNNVPNKNALCLRQENPKSINTKNQIESITIKNETKPPQAVKRRIQIRLSPITGNHQSDNDSDDHNPEKLSKIIAKHQLPTCQLLTLLPAPKNSAKSTNTSLVPDIVRKTQFSGAKPPKNPYTVVTQAKIDSDDEAETFDDHTWLKIYGRRTPPKIFKTTTSLGSENPLGPINLTPEAQKPYRGLDNAAFRKLIGKRKKLQEHPIELIDVHEDDLRSAEPTSLKLLTEPTWYNSESNLETKSQVNNTCKAKNHITSLAQNALANDAQLQMRWSEDRHNRRLTQAKYGF